MGKGSVPKAPDYSQLMAGSQNVAASTLEATKIQADIAREQMAKQDIYAGRSADVADQYLQMTRDQAAYGRGQYEDIKPYLQSYMQSQLDFTGAAMENQKAQMADAALSRQRATETYDRYMRTYAPREDQFLREAFDYASPARMEQAAAEARGDVATSFGAQKDAASRQLMSYGVDPSQGAFGRTQAMDIAKAASQAAAGTMSRRQTEMQGRELEMAALGLGKNLPAQAIGQGDLGIRQAAAGLSGAAIGGGGLGQAAGLLTAGTTAMGSPTQYAALSNPYTTLSGAYGTQVPGLFGNQMQGFGIASGAYGKAGEMLNNQFSNQMEAYKAKAAQSPWGAIGKIAGTIGGSLIGGPFGGAIGGSLGGMFGGGGDAFSYGGGPGNWSSGSDWSSADPYS